MEPRTARLSAFAAAFFVEYEWCSAVRLLELIVFCYNNFVNKIRILCDLFIDISMEICYNINAVYI